MAQVMLKLGSGTLVSTPRLRCGSLARGFCESTAECFTRARVKPVYDGSCYVAG